MTESSEKFCPNCKQTKPIDKFHKNKYRYDGRQSYCAECLKILRRTTQRKSDLLRKFNITDTEYDQLLENQDGKCAICGNTNRSGNRLAVDHNHDTGEVRELLCHRCNTGIGLFEDNSDLLERARNYLTKWEN